MYVQPKDHTRFIQCTIGHYDEGVTPAQIYNINQLQAMQIVDVAWCAVNTTTIHNCWHKAGIFPKIDSTASQSLIPITLLLNNPSSEFQTELVTYAEKQVEAALS